MAKRPSTYFGEPLSAESKKLVNEVRLKINQPIHPNVSSTSSFLFYFNDQWIYLTTTTSMLITFEKLIF